MRTALVVGINYYEHISPLFGCVNDAKAVNDILGFNDDYDRSKNFDCKLLTCTDASNRIGKSQLKDNIATLFQVDADIALFYFAGHGHLETTGGYMLASDSMRGDEGVSLTEVLTLANASPARNRVIVLDSCHSGFAGSSPTAGNLASLSEGLTILAASTKNQYATEENGRGVFSSLFVDALQGGAANLIGDVTPSSVFAHIDQSLGTWMQQRPVFKTNVKNFVSLRKSASAISTADLRRLTEFFPSAGFEYPLDPSYEKEMKGRDEGMPPPDEYNVQLFAILQRYNRLNLVTPVGVKHMWNAAMKYKGCKLTLLGEHYRRLVAQNRI